MSSLLMETSQANITDFDSNLNYNFTSTSINGGFSKQENESNIDKKFNHFKKLYQSLEDIENSLGELSKQKKKSKAENLRSFKMRPSSYRSGSCDFSREKNPFYSPSTKSVKFKDMEFASSEVTDNHNIARDIKNLKLKIDDIHQMSLNKKTCQLDDLQKNISKSLRKSGTISGSFERIDNQFFEINRILTDLNESKALLRKTQNQQQEKYESDTASYNSFSKSEEEIIHTENPVHFTVKLTSDSERSDYFRENSKTEFDSLLDQFEKMRKENLKLKTKICEIEHKNDKNEFMKRMSLTILPDLPRINETESLRLTISRLNEENNRLKQELEQLKELNNNELIRIRAEFNVLRESHSNEIKLKTKTNRDLQSEVSTLKLRLKMEEEQREEIRVCHMNELEAAKIRYENELSAQNNFMQSKYDDLVREIENLNHIIKQIQAEKNELVTQIKKERTKNRTYYAQKCTTTSTTRTSQGINRFNKMANSMSDLSEGYARVQEITTIPITFKDSKNDSLHSSTIIYDTSAHSRNQPVKYISSYHISPETKVIDTFSSSSLISQ